MNASKWLLLCYTVYASAFLGVAHFTNKVPVITVWPVSQYVAYALVLAVLLQDLAAWYFKKNQDQY